MIQRQQFKASFLALILIVSVRASSQVHVQTAGGELEGALSSDVASFEGIPYAKAPVGHLRWTPPQPADHWSGVRQATSFGANCIQAKSAERLPWTKEFLIAGPISEDCLYLNVWTPSNFSGRKLPVYVYIHGGGFVEGSGSVPVYDGANFARKGFVFVSINYRLGPLGFLALRELTAESSHHASGNYGLLDAIAALQWVRDNIAAFGGDPAKVTIGGQSAGSSQVHDVVASPLAKGLMRAAVAESGTGFGFTTATLTAAEADGTKFAESLGVATLAELRALPAERLVPPPGAPGLRFAPIADGWSLPDAPLTIAEAGKQNDVPLLTGMQADEGSAFGSYGTMSAADWNQQVQTRYRDMAHRFAALYPVTDDRSAHQAEKTSARDRGAASMYLWLSRSLEHEKANVFTYYFGRGIPWPEHPEFAAFHTGEMVYILANLDKLPRPFTPDDKRISEEMSGYLSNFVRAGDPNGHGLPMWAPFNAGTHETLDVNAKTQMRPYMSAAKLSFWTDYFNSPLGDAAPMF